MVLVGSLSRSGNIMDKTYTIENMWSDMKGGFFGNRME